MAITVRREHWQHDDNTWTISPIRVSVGVVQDANTIDDIIRTEYAQWGADDHSSVSDTCVEFVKHTDDPEVSAWQRITIIAGAW